MTTALTRAPGAILLCASVLGLSACTQRDQVQIRFIDIFPAADKRATLPISVAFSVFDATLDGVRSRAIFARPPSDLAWSIDIPARAALKGAVGLLQEAWLAPGDGVIFTIEISSAAGDSEVFRRRVNPFRHRLDRRWLTFDVSLDQFAGTHARVRFKTTPSPPDRSEDTRSDLAVWGEPAVVVRPR